MKTPNVDTRWIRGGVWTAFPVGEAAGIHKPSTRAGWSHRWRHSCGTELVRAKDLSLVEIMAQMGWTDPDMIRIYAASDPESPEAMKAATKRARPKKRVKV
jgi:integrase